MANTARILLWGALTLALTLWVWVEGGDTPGERTARARGCVLCHADDWQQLHPALQHHKPGSPITPALQQAIAQAHPALSSGVTQELAEYLAARQLPHLAAAHQGKLGATLYVAKCAACHGRQGEGQPGAYPPLKGSEWLHATPSRLPEILTEGLRGPITVRGEAWDAIMLPPGLSSEAEVNAVIEHIRSM